MIKKAIVTAAGRGTRHYPATNTVQKELFPLVDRDGITKPVIQIILEEVFDAGIEEVALVIQPGMESRFKDHFQGLADARKAFEDKPWALRQSEMIEKIGNSITYIAQTEQHGFGHAVYCADNFVGDDPVLLLLGDHIYLSHVEQSCIQQVTTIHQKYQRTVLAVQQTHINDLHLFGTVHGSVLKKKAGLYELTTMIEKPTPEQARQHLVIPELPDDMFLTIFGIYCLTPTLFHVLGEHVRQNKRERGEIQLTSALSEVLQREGAIGYQVSGERLDMGTPLGYLHTLVAMAKNGIYRRELKGLTQSLKVI